MKADDISAAVRDVLTGAPALHEVRMFGGIGFMLNGNMVAAASRRGLLLRVGKDRQDEVLTRPGARPMEMRDGRLRLCRSSGACGRRHHGMASTSACLRADAATQDIPRKDGTDERKEAMMRLVLGVVAYLVPTFALGFVWHLVLFEGYYDALAIYRTDIIIPFGFLSMLIQAVIFAWIYQQLFARRSGTLISRALLYGGLGAALSWSFTTLAVAAKNIMASVPDYLLIETAFTAVQWIMVAPLTVLAFGRLPVSRR